MPVAPLTDQQIEQAWAEWEDPHHIGQFMMDWIEMTIQEKMAFFYGMILPRVYGGRRARGETLQRIWDLGLVSRYPSKSAVTT